jgi:hypothetical protein
VLQRKDHFLQSDIDNALEKMNTDINTLRNSKDYKAFDFNRTILNKTNDKEIIDRLMKKASITDDMVAK